MADAIKPPEAEHIEFEIIKDAWQVVQLGDGFRLRLKLVVMDVVREVLTGQERTYKISGQLLVIPEPPADPKSVQLEGEVRK